MADINQYKTVMEQFLEKRKEHPEESGRKVPIDTDQLPTGGIKNVDAAVMVIDIADSKQALSTLGEDKYIEWLGLALHCFFHCVDDHHGAIDKYTGDGAMVSFSLGSQQERCQNALECSLRISELLDKVLNPYFAQKNYTSMKIRIGIDFGPIKIEKIGKIAKSQLIITGISANFAKELEEKGKELQTYYQDTIICFGYDILFNLTNKDVTNSEGKVFYRYIGSINSQSYMDQSKPYKYYEFTGRYL